MEPTRGYGSAVLQIKLSGFRPIEEAISWVLSKVH